MNQVSGDVSEPEVATVMAVSELLVVEAHQMQDRGVQVMNGGPVFDCFVAKIVGSTILGTTFGPTAGKPHGEGIGVVIATGAVALRVGGAAKFAAPDHQSLVEHAALLEIGKQGADWLVDRPSRDRMVGFDVVVTIPWDVVDSSSTAIGSCENMDEAYTALDQTPCGQELATDQFGVFGADAVEFAGGFAFVVQVKGVGRGGLHAVGQLVGFLPSLQVGGVEALRPMGIVEEFDGIELGSLLVIGEVVETVKVVDDLLVAAVDGSGLKDLGKETGRPDRIFPAWFLGGMQDKGTGQGFVGGAEPVHQPTGDTGKALTKEAGGKLEHGRCMVVRARIHGVNESHVVDVIGKMGEEIGNPGSGFAVLLEGKGGGQALAARREKAGFRIRVRQGLAVVFVEHRLVVEGVHLRRRAGHVKPYDAFGFGWEMSGAEG